MVQQALAKSMSRASIFGIVRNVNLSFWNNEDYLSKCDSTRSSKVPI